MKLFYVLAVAAATLCSGCIADKNVVYDQFVEVNSKDWSWHDTKTYSFTITESDYIYNIDCGLRITGDYEFANIWLLYQLEGPSLNRKEKFQIQLADNTGKWLGKGSNNLISFSSPILTNVKLKPGKYTLRLNQNMSEENLEYTTDIGIKVTKVSRIY